MCLKEETICYKIKPIVRNRVTKLEFAQAQATFLKGIIEEEASA